MTDITSDDTFEYEITNTHGKETTSVKVLKSWDDADNQDGYRPANVKVQLLADGEAYGKEEELNAGNGWAFTWSGLDKYSNGLTHIGDKLYGEKLFEHVNLIMGERSRLSELAGKKL